MRIFHRTGIELPAGVLRTLIPGHRNHGETTGPELVKVMRLFGLRPVYERVASNAVQSLLEASVVAGNPPIVLGNWVSPLVPHWLLVVDAMMTGAVVNDPWGGRRYFLPIDRFLTRYLGDCIL